MPIGTKMVIDRFGQGGPVKKYRVTPEQLERNEREQTVQRERDKRAQNEASRHSQSPTEPRGRLDQRA